jgi:hypothetical protein
MKIMNEIIEKLMSSGIEFDGGLSEKEFVELEALYSIKFPADLKALYSNALPVSTGFYDWRDRNDVNIQRIRTILKSPIMSLLKELRDGYFWCDEWGEKPNNINKAEQVLMDHYNDAPILIPIYSHRYIPFIENEEDLPVFSIMGSDIIYYGENLLSYLENEFGFRSLRDLNQNKCKYVPFWSDLL